jgi:hypothetical protein
VAKCFTEEGQILLLYIRSVERLMKGNPCSFTFKKKLNPPTTLFHQLSLCETRRAERARGCKEGEGGWLQPISTKGHRRGSLSISQQLDECKITIPNKKKRWERDKECRERERGEGDVRG